MASSTKSSWISWRLLNNFLFYRGGLLAPRPNPISEDQASVFISPRGRVATHFSHLLRHAWVMVGLFLFPGHHTGINHKLKIMSCRLARYKVLMNGKGILKWLEIAVCKFVLVKVKLFLCPAKHHAMKTYGGVDV
jgi:hypothetical protein